MSAMEKLTENNAQILRVVHARGRVTVDELTEALPAVDAVPYRVAEMANAQQECVHNCLRAIPNTSYLMPDGDGYVLTDLGRAALQDFEKETRSARTRTFRDKLLLPILVTLFTGLIAALSELVPRLLR